MPDADDRPGDSQGLAAFDFDGTLTVRDSFMAFLVWRTPPARLIAAFFRLAPAAVAYLIHRDRGRLKAAGLRILIGCIPQTNLQAEAEAFADVIFDRLLRPDARAAWTRHRAEGLKLIIVTASPEDIVAPFARRLGADALIGTRLAIDAAGRLTGALDGPNCRGAEKVRRSHDAFGAAAPLAVAYGDTDGDREMLAAAAAGHMKQFTERP